MATKAKTAAKKYKFSLKHFREEDFKADGLRPYAEYRDLGVAAATGGDVQAHVIRHAVGFTPDKRQSPRHYHTVQFQMVYVMKGWIKTDFGKEGVHTMRAGACFVQPSGLPHKVLDTSEDMELLEIILPAQFPTVDLEKKAP